ncbi:MAG TPA: hypothetical protein VIM11_21925 [Tepidisphaeraceae bacterium]|jgi:hypothetical protein
MNPLKLRIGIALLTIVVTGCAHQTTPEEARAKSEQSIASGRDKFYEELVQKNVTWYVTGGQKSTGFNRETGLPEQTVSADAEFVKSHNGAIRSYIAANGPVPGSFLPWESSLFDQAGYFKAHSDEQPAQLKEGNAINSTQYTLSIARAGKGSQLIVEGPGGKHQVAAPAGASEPTADVLFGPGGSDLAFTRWPGAGGEAVYAAVNLRNGTYVVVQRGAK